VPGSQMRDRMSPGLSKVAERAQREPEAQFHSLAHLLDVPALALRRSMRRAVTLATIVSRPHTPDRHLHGLIS